jgi:hypothetical protein
VGHHVAFANITEAAAAIVAITVTVAVATSAAITITIAPNTTGTVMAAPSPSTSNIDFTTARYLTATSSTSLGNVSVRISTTVASTAHIFTVTIAVTTMINHDNATAIDATAIPGKV